MNEYINLDEKNIEKEHICCALSDKKGNSGVAKKKEWLKTQIANGLVFRKADVSGKVFIEYLPAENAWIPVQADNYYLINCLWVSGSFKGQGHGRALIESCIEDAKAKNKYGIIGLSSDKKRGFLSDPVFKLYCLRLDKDAPLPSFKECARQGTVEDTENVVIYYSNQCPFTEDYVREIGKEAEKRDITFRAVKYDSMEMAQNAPVPSTTFSLFRDGKFVTHEVQSASRFLKLMGLK